MGVTDIEVFETITRVVASVTERRQETLYRKMPLTWLHLDESQIARIRTCLERQFGLNEDILKPLFAPVSKTVWPITIGDIENTIAEICGA